MTALQKVITYFAMAFAVLLTVSIIGGVLGIFGMLDGDGVAKDVTTYAISSDVRRLEVDIRAAALCIKQGENFSVESNLKHLTVKDGDGVLTVKEEKTFGGTYADAVLTLYIPADATFESATVSAGAGKLTIERLSAAVIDLNLGAGEVSVGTLIATSDAKIDGGAGKVTIADGALHNLDLNMGVGELNLTSALSGESNLDLGVGQSNVTVIGNKDDYRLSVDKGIGNVLVDGVSVSDAYVQGNGSHRIEIDSGVGGINLRFLPVGAR